MKEIINDINELNKKNERKDILINNFKNGLFINYNTGLFKIDEKLISLLILMENEDYFFMEDINNNLIKIENINEFKEKIISIYKEKSHFLYDSLK